MKKTALRFGLYATITIIGIFFAGWLIDPKHDNFGTQEIIGWATILLSTLFVYFGLKYYRDRYNGGALSFPEGLKLGLLIVLFPAVAFGLFNLLYVAVLDPGFFDKYYAYQVAQVTKSTPAAELDQSLKELKEQRDMYASPVVQFVVMFLSVFVIGVIVTVISTFLLKRKRVAVVSV